MQHATLEYHNRLVLVFDFDGTLAPNAIDQMLELAGEDAGDFRKNKRKKLEAEGWDSLIANMYCLLQLAEQNKDFRLHRDSLKKQASQIKIFKGVPAMFGKIRRWVKAILPDAEVEFYLLSSGLVDLYRHTKIAKEFKATWGSEFFFDKSGKAVFVKQVITHQEKVHYILRLAKGMGLNNPDSKVDVYQEVPEKDWYVPLDQMVYVGDGLTDMPAFSLMHQHGGIALGVVDTEEIKDWEGYKGTSQKRRVQNLALADYSANSELMQSLRFSVESIAKLMALRKLSKGE